MFSSDKALVAIQYNARAIWRTANCSLVAALTAIHKNKLDCPTPDDLRFWQEVEKEVTHIARKAGVFK